MSGLERYVERYQARMAAAGMGGNTPPDRRRMLALTAAFTPMIAVAALPVTVLIALAASTLAAATTPWVGPLLPIVVMVGLGYLTARWAANYDGLPATRGWRRWLPVAVTGVVVGACLAEILSGSRAPYPVIALWLISIVWVAAFLPLAAGVWGGARRAMWIIAPAVTSAAIIFVATQGLFAWRFARAVPDLEALAQQVVDGADVPDGTDVGGFAVHEVNVSRLARANGCEVEWWMTGWHQEDTRYVARCPDDPTGDFRHLTGRWWEIRGRTPPSDL